VSVFQEADARMIEWAHQALGEPIAALRPPAAGPTGRGVALHLLDVLPERPSHERTQTRFDAWLRYLVTVWADSPEQAHDLLGRLMFAALATPELKLDGAEPPGPAFWQAFGVPPQPCLLVQRRVSQEVPVKPAKLVRKSVFEAVPSVTLHGTVLGPEAIPIAGAWVSLPALDLLTNTDAHGRFRFPAVPALQGSRRLVVRAKGREQTLELTRQAAGSPLTIHFDLKE
jgi:hypothetical protein